MLLLDADEEISPESKEAVLDALNRQDVLAYSVLRQDAYGAGPNSASLMYQTRLFRNGFGLRFKHRFHHQFAPPLQETAAKANLLLLHSDIVIRHYGYIDELPQQKLKRSAHWMRLELEDVPDQFYFLVELGKTELAMGDIHGWSLLARAAEKAIRSSEDACGGPLSILLEVVLGRPDLPSRFPLSPSEATRMALDRFPTSIPLLWHISRKDFLRNDFTACAQRLELISSLWQTQSYDKLVSFDPRPILRDLKLNLGVCYVRMSQLKKATLLFQQLKDEGIHIDAAQANLRAIERMIGKR